MATLEFFVVAESVAVDRFTNQLSIFNVLEEVTMQPAGPAQGPPEGHIALSPSLVAVGTVRAEDGDLDVDWQAQLKFVADGLDSQIPPATLNFRFKSERGRQRIIFRVNGLPFGHGKDVRFELLLNGKHMASHDVSVKVAEAGDQSSAH